MALEYLAMDAAILSAEIDLRERAAEWAVLRQVDSPFDLDESQFIQLFRLTPEVANNLIEAIGSSLEKKTISALSAENQVLSALRFYATGCYQRPVGQQVRITMSQSSVSRCIHRVTDAINDQIFRSNVRFPMTHIERQAARTLFRTANQPFDGAIGAIDCAHFAVHGPARHEEAYVNHYGYHSINVQMICDPNLRILNVNARYPGARHDSYIWHASAARQVMQRAYDRGERRTFLIGDSGYPLEPWLMTPLTHQQEGTPKFLYNRALCKARNAIERCFGVLKGRWRCCAQERVLMYEPGFCGRIVNACAVLHNMSISSLSASEVEEILLTYVQTESSAVIEVENGSRLSIAKRIQDRIICENFT